MDPPDSDQEAESAAMAAMMGFTSFGAPKPPPSKKRRYNPRADAATAADSDPDESEPWGTGANTLPLLPRSVVRGGGVGETAMEGGGEAEQGGEIDLGLEGSDAAGDEGAGRGAGGDDEDPAPRYIDTSRSPVRTGGDETASAPSAAASGYGGYQPAGGRGGRGGGGGGAGPPGGKRIWWTDYYDPSSNENPWEGLEKARGLEPVGSWLPRGHGGGRVGGGRSG
ncbi:hypothetical protein CONLIGDRAFT_418246 [Coniochaeta ligniaria NRRL 30616]|uniref:Uncharacterized protein n=1 Tax=Coniochaeta ligniaria NRRL 30616 TaxID=1408157 RepID=A0A1J7IIC1_9PEZI|nr:hypothetical protein CONLIGDRAFT_418246 [Coniochaeta ligniaria NRRL 30616]